MSDQSAKQQIIDELRDAETVLVALNKNPTVDELSAALGLTLLLNKANKHGTAVFSGDIPPAITFLDPKKTFENTVDSLRDFIIALDKEKADHLRYKLDGDLVKVFITPYKTTISEDDLEFTQGDYNVEMVVALGVRDESDLDAALADHGKIMHDATVASISVGGDASNLGTISWHESDASSYSELLVSVAEALRQDKNLIDEQIATAFLTGIVAATDRFSNQQTTSKSMTMAAQLMAAGANQQLIASKLEEASESGQTKQSKKTEEETASSNTSSSRSKQRRKKRDSTKEAVKDKPAADGTMQISHEKSGDVDEVARQTEADSQAEAAKAAEEKLARQLAASQTQAPQPATPSIEDLQQDLKAASEEIDASIAPAQSPELELPTPGAENAQAPQSTTPSIGGTLNATTEEAAEAKRREEASDRNKTILTHNSSSYAGNPPENAPALNSYGQSTDAEPKSTDIFADTNATAKSNDLSPQPANDAAPSLPPFPTSEPAAETSQPSEPAPQPEATNAVNDAMQAAAPAETQQSSVPGFTPTPPQTDSQSSQPTQEQPAAGNQPAPAPDFSSLPPLPPMPDMSNLGPLPPPPPLSPQQTAEDTLAQSLPQQPAPTSQFPNQPAQGQPADPGQFQIPGQS